MTKKLELFKKKLLYRASYRGTKEMDILLSSFVNKYINDLEEKDLNELDKFLKFEDETISNYYYYDIVNNNIDKNRMSLIFKKFKP